MNFNELNLPDYVMQALSDMGFANPTEIQYKAIPKIIEGKDIIGKSQTGSGKTFAYGIPAIMSIDTDIKYPQVLVVCPTRELASQVCDELRKITVLRPGCRIVPIFGGSNMDRQIDALKKGARIVVGTPGRLMDHLRRRTLKLHELKMVVLDEADEMLDMGFREDIETILKTTNNTHQTVMFSATMPKEIMALTKLYMVSPELVEITEPQSQLVIHQYFVNVGLKDKALALRELIRTIAPHISIVFCNTKKMVENLTEELNREHINALGLHGDMRQNERRKVMQEVKRVANLEVKNSSVVLVATDVAARGIDINGVDAVFNYDLPNDHDYYTHRIGRTGRAGKVGYSYSIINTKPQLVAIKDLIRSSGKDIEEYAVSCSKSVGKIESKDRQDFAQASRSNDRRQPCADSHRGNAKDRRPQDTIDYKSKSPTRTSRPSQADKKPMMSIRPDRVAKQSRSNESITKQRHQDTNNKLMTKKVRSTPPFQEWDIADDEEYRQAYGNRGSRYGRNQHSRNEGNATRQNKPSSDTRASHNNRDAKNNRNNYSPKSRHDDQGSPNRNDKRSNPSRRSAMNISDKAKIYDKRSRNTSRENVARDDQPKAKAYNKSQQNVQKHEKSNRSNNRTTRLNQPRTSSDRTNVDKKFASKRSAPSDQKPKRNFWGKRK